MSSINKELNYGTAVYYKIYESLGLPQFFGSFSSYYNLPFDFNAVVFAICYFNIECKLNDPLDLRFLNKRRCIFDFTDATTENIKKVFEILKEYEHHLVPFIEERTKDIITTKTQKIKHSPNPMVVMKSLAYLMRCLFFKTVRDAGYEITKEPLFTLLNQGTILKRSYTDEGYIHVNRAFGIYAEEANPLNVQSLMAIYGIDASLPMRNYAELKAALKVDFPLNPCIKAESPETLPPAEPDFSNIGNKPGVVEDSSKKLHDLNFLFPDGARRSRERLRQGGGAEAISDLPVVSPLPPPPPAEAAADAEPKAEDNTEAADTAEPAGGAKTAKGRKSAAKSAKAAADENEDPHIPAAPGRPARTPEQRKAAAAANLAKARDARRRKLAQAKAAETEAARAAVKKKPGRPRRNAVKGSTDNSSAQQQQ